MQEWGVKLSNDATHEITRAQWNAMSDALVLRFPNLSELIEAYRAIFNVVSSDGHSAFLVDIRQEMEKMSGVFDKLQEILQRRLDGLTRQ